MRVLPSVPNAVAQDADSVEPKSVNAPVDPPRAAPSAARVRYGRHLSRR